MYKFLVAALVAMTLVGCSFSKDNNNAAARENEENQRLLSELSAVIGNYAGTMTTGDFEYSIEVNLDTVNKKVDNQEDGNGQDRVRPQLMADYQKIAPAGNGYIFNVKYIKETRSLKFTNVDAGKTGANGDFVLGPDDIHTIDATLEGEYIRGPVKNRSAVTIGKIEIHFVSKQQGLPNGKQEQAKYDRLRRDYEAIVGIYSGYSEKDGVSTPFTMKIELIPQPAGTVSYPVLTGWIMRTDDSLGTTKLNLTFNYLTDRSPKELYIEGNPVDIDRLKYLAKFRGTLENGAYEGTWSTYRGYEGAFTLRLEKPINTGDPATCSKRGDFPCLPEPAPTPIFRD